jgi:hypothetical protein
MTTASLNLNVPTPHAMSLLAPECEHSIVLPKGSQTHITNVEKGAIAALCLTEAVRRHTNRLPNEAAMAWTSDVCTRVCEAVVAIAHRSPQSAGGRSLHLLCEMKCAEISIVDDLAKLPTHSTSICRQLSFMLRCIHVCTYGPFQRSISKLLVLLSPSPESLSSAQTTFSLLVAPLVSKIVQHERYFRSLDVDTKVRNHLALLFPIANFVDRSVHVFHCILHIRENRISPAEP